MLLVFEVYTEEIIFFFCLRGETDHAVTYVDPIVLCRASYERVVWGLWGEKYPQISTIKSPRVPSIPSMLPATGDYFHTSLSLVKTINNRFFIK